MTNKFSVMAALICIQIVHGTFCQLVNIANRFLRIFSNLETLIRFIFPGGAGYPYLPTQLNGYYFVVTYYYFVATDYHFVVTVYYFAATKKTYFTFRLRGFIRLRCMSCSDIPDART